MVKRQICLILPYGQAVEIIETGRNKLYAKGDRREVENIYRWAFTTFNLKTAQNICVIIAKNYLNALIDNM
jgi:hypothetical protein